MTAALLEWETIDAEQIEDIMQGRPPRPPRPAGNTGSGNTPPAPPAPATPTIKPAQEV
jgi:cell division protease FtsH